MSTYGVGFGDGGQAMLDTDKKLLVVSRKGPGVLKLDSIFDILRLRDLLNDAYPPGEVEYDKNMRMRSRS